MNDAVQQGAAVVAERRAAVRVGSPFMFDTRVLAKKKKKTIKL